VTGSHSFGSAGAYPVTVCVEDQIGGTGCDALIATVHFVLFADDFESGTTSAWTTR